MVSKRPRLVQGMRVVMSSEWHGWQPEESYDAIGWLTKGTKIGDQLVMLRSYVWTKRSPIYGQNQACQTIAAQRR